jgi:hypothetical protein
VVSSSDAGAGIGYTYLRVRGSDASRINVTINGIPYNDAESQGTFGLILGILPLPLKVYNSNVGLEPPPMGRLPLELV